MQRTECIPVSYGVLVKGRQQHSIPAPQVDMPWISLLLHILPMWHPCGGERGPDHASPPPLPLL